MQTQDSASATDNMPATTVAILSDEGIAINTPDDSSPALVNAAPAPEIESAAISAARANIATIETALTVLGDNAAASVLREQLDIARGTLALAQADATIEAEKMAEIAAATAAAANLPPALLDAMLAAIETKYAPAPPVAAPAPAPYIGRKPIGLRTAQRNAVSLAHMAADSSVGTRASAAYAAFRKDWQPDNIGVRPAAGTRYVSMVAFAGDGVANASDYLSFVPQLRRYLIDCGLASGGDSAASLAWLTASGPHSAGGPKGNDTLASKFASRAEIAMFADGRFRLAAGNTTGVRWLHSDAAAQAAWSGASTPPTAPATTPRTPATTPAAPAPPTTVALPSGVLATTSRCQHCTARNIVGQPTCNACSAADWHVA
jgi:hypothetical protein